VEKGSREGEGLAKKVLFGSKEQRRKASKCLKEGGGNVSLGKGSVGKRLCRPHRGKLVKEEDYRPQSPKQKLKGKTREETQNLDQGLNKRQGGKSGYEHLGGDGGSNC